MMTIVELMLFSTFYLCMYFLDILEILQGGVARVLLLDCLKIDFIKENDLLPSASIKY